MIINGGKKNLLWERWLTHSKDFPHKDAIVHWSATGEPFRWSFKSLLDASVYIAVYLRENGIKEGDVCAIIIRHNKFFYPLYMAVCAIGAIPSVLAYPNTRLHPEKFRSSLKGMSQKSGLDWIFTERELEDAIAPLVFHEKSTIRGLHFPLEHAEKYSAHNCDHDALFQAIEQIRLSFSDTMPLLLQHSSGTTGLQKGVVLSNKAIGEHVDNYCSSLKATQTDRVVSWLPLYHDMGLIAAFHLPLAFGMTSIQIDPFEWVLYPAILLEVIDKEKPTLSWLPNFSFNMMADKIHEDDIDTFDFSSIRMLINCSEPVRADSHEMFYKRFAKYGLSNDALTACYAMAETTYAATQSTPGARAKELTVDRESLSAGIVKMPLINRDSRVCVSSGLPINGCEIKIIDEGDKELGDDFVGEILIKSNSMFDGYRNSPEKTAEVLKGDWYYSGDFGFRHDNEYYVIGRKKDIIIVAGKNIYPEDIEDAVGKIEGVSPGRVVAFGIFKEEIGTEQICVIAETSLDESARKILRTKIIEAGMELSVTITQIHLVEPRWLIKSSSGKPSRKANKERILIGGDK
ncbi:MAG: AMP-binding protein [Elusimicrobia bacterium]|nr:AMP-binding protein [Elusimicrobiota bacterium]